MVQVSAKDAEAGVAQRTQLALTESPIYALRELLVEHHGEQLLISGKVSSFYHKQLAQEAVRQIAKGLHVVNQIDVAD